MRYTDDPLRDFEHYDQEQANEYRQLPFCDECDERIEDDFLYEFNDTLICEKCIENKHKKMTSDYMEG